MRIDSFGAPLMVAWQITKDCDLACLHCCSESSPGKRLPDELSSSQANTLAEQIIRLCVPYVLLGGGEPALSRNFLPVAETLGRAGVYVKIETNGQNFSVQTVERLSRLPIRSIQVSLDAVTPRTYTRLRPNASLDSALGTCRLVRQEGLPLEITFAPTKFNIHEAGAVMDLALELGAFRFNTGRLMCLGRAAQLWEELEPSSQDYGQFLKLLQRKSGELAGRLELRWKPFDLREALKEWLAEPPGTLFVLPDGKVKVSAFLPFICADLRRDSLAEAWDAYRAACRSGEVSREIRVLLGENLPVVV